ncbi:MAG: DUF2726 domain-containing protein [Pirellulales bacterium]
MAKSSRRRRRHKLPLSREPLPYQPRGTLLSRGEGAFFRALRVALRGEYLIAFKVRLADLITCRDTAWDAGFGHLIARQHLDFVLCDWKTTEILVAVELDDRSHKLARRRRRDSFVNDALAAAGIPLVRFQAAFHYDAAVVAAALVAAMPSHLHKAS